MIVKKIEDIFEKNTVDYIGSIRKLFDDAKTESIEVVNLQLNKFREVNQMGKFENFDIIIM